jgi:hypothetical protein
MILTPSAGRLVYSISIRKNGTSEMTLTIKKLMAIAVLLTAARTQALPIVQADAFAAGDNKAALEISTGLVWMDFGVNDNETYSQVKSKLNTDYLGWRLPTGVEVQHLWTSLFSTMPGWHEYSGLSFLDEYNLDAEFESIFAILGSGKDATRINTNTQTEVTETWQARSGFGVFQSDSSKYGLVNMFEPYDSIHNDESLYLEFYVDVNDWYGTMLVKNTNVPEPSSLMMFGLGLLGLLFSRRRMNQ